MKAAAARDMKPAAVRPEGSVGGVRPEWIAGFVLAAFAALSVMNLLAIYVLQGQFRGFQRLARLVYFDTEANFATLFNFLLLIGIAGLLALHAARGYREGGRWRHHWAGLVVIFLLMAFDEAARMHEQMSPIVRGLVELDGYLTFAWVIPGLGFVLVVGLLYLRFLLALPREVAALVLLGGGLFVTGALGLELLGGKLWSEQAADTLAYRVIATLEETLEMLGLVVFGYALMRLLADADGRLRLESLAPRPQSQPRSRKIP